MITRRNAVLDVLRGKRSQAEAARYYGYSRSAICKWLKKRPKHYLQYIETKSSAPKKCWNQTPPDITNRVIELRLETGRCAQILHAMLKNEGITISLSTVTRIIRRNKLTRKKKQLKPRYAKIARPKAEKPGDLVEMDTIHYVKSDGSRFYIYAVIDVCSRYGYAQYSKNLSTKRSAEVARKAQKAFKFSIKVLQTDNGGEFGEDFNFRLQRLGIQLRHTRPRKPNDNAHIERFNRTIQEEGFKWALPKEKTIKKDLDKFINYYNNKRFHLGINCNIPCNIVSKLLN
jgi:transposase InsO family protein